MNLTARISTVFVSAFLISTGVYAGCEKVKTECSHYIGTKLFKRSACVVDECANAHGALQEWKWPGYNINIELDGKGGVLINGKPGYLHERNSLLCFGERNSGPDLFCRKD